MEKELEIYQVICSMLSNEDEDYKNISIEHKKTYTNIYFFDSCYLRVKALRKTNYISVYKIFKKSLKQLEINSIKKSQNNNWINIYFDDLQEIHNLKDLIVEIYNYVYMKSSKDVFGCCHLYVECSDAKKCIHTDRNFYRNCQYRTNLINGKIFYGKNAI